MLLYPKLPSKLIDRNLILNIFQQRKNNIVDNFWIFSMWSLTSKKAKSRLLTLYFQYYILGFSLLFIYQSSDSWNVYKSDNLYYYDCTWDDWIGTVEYKIKWHYHQKTKTKERSYRKKIFLIKYILGVWSEFFKS